ncbi:MAG: LTA synthase family protein [Anaerobutyricum soehngenii]
MNKLRKRKAGIRTFFKGKHGRNFLLALDVLLAVAFFAKPDLYYNPEAPKFFDRFYADSLIICGGLWVALVFLTVKKIHFSAEVNKILTYIAGIATPFMAFLWLEFYNDAQFWVPIFSIPFLYLILDIIVYYVIYVLFLLLFNSIRGASICMIIVTAVFGIFNYELTLFRSMSFIASDIYSFVTAVSVANTYQLQVDVDTAEFFMMALVLVALLLKLDKEKLFKWKGRIIYTLVSCMIFAGFTQVYVYSDYLENIGVDFRVYRPQYKYRYYGTLLTTMRTFGYLHVTQPEDYSVSAVKKITKQYTDSNSTESTETKKPNIIAIMNESFADLKEVGDLQVSQDYMPFFRKLKENTIKGYTYSSVFGGNTANSEFEFMTGNTLAFLPDNSVPYQLFLRSKTAGLTHTLKNQGYSPCYALHPFYKTGYSRYKVYPLMGFDKFYTSDNFSVFTDTVNYHITDSEDYKKLISLYENRTDKDKPFYLFNVTMQNHGSYDGSTLETGDDVQIEGDLQSYSKAEQYLNMIKMSDNALKELVHYFEKVDEPTVIVFFGDHQPDLEEDFYNRLLHTDIQKLEGEELEKLYKVPFLIWANYDIKEENVERTSNNYLSTYLAEVAGIKKTGYLEYLTKLRKKFRQLMLSDIGIKMESFTRVDDKNLRHQSPNVITSV